MGLNGLNVINIELTSRCNKNCWMCGRRKLDRDYPKVTMNYGDMDFNLLKKLSKEIPRGLVIQFHNNGEPTLYPRLGDALKLFPNNIRNFDTNGKLIIEKADEIIDNMETITISVIENDKEGDEQYSIVKEFIDIKGKRKPLMIYRLLGEIKNRERWEKLPGVIANRLLHHPLGNYKYKKNPTVPEIGICLDLLSHLVIDRYGWVYPCVRFDPENLGVIGDINEESLEEIWNSKERTNLIKSHLKNDRTNASPICRTCQFWGVPTG